MPRGQFLSGRVVLCMQGMPRNDKAAVVMGWGGGRNMCFHIYTGYRLLPPTSSLLWFGERSPLSVLSECVWERMARFFFHNGGGEQIIRSVRGRKSPWAGKGLLILLVHFLLLPILLRFLSRCGSCFLEADGVLHAACFTTDWQLVFVILPDLIVPQSDAKLLFHSVILNCFGIWFLCWIRGAVLFSFPLRSWDRLKRRVMCIWRGAYIKSPIHPAFTGHPLLWLP